MAIQKSCGFCPPEVRDSGGAEENNSGSSIGGIKEEEKKKEEKKEDKEPVDTTLTKATDDTETTETEHVTENYGGYGKTEDYVPNENEYGWSGGSGGDSEENPMKKDEIDRLPILPVRMMPVTNAPTKPKTRETPPPVQKKATPNVVNTQKVTETKVAELPPALTKKVYKEPAVAHEVIVIYERHLKEGVSSIYPIEYREISDKSLQDTNTQWPNKTPESFADFVKQRNDVGSGLVRTCEDYVIELIVEYAKLKKLPIVIDRPKGVPRSEIKSMSIQDLKNAMMSTMAAEDLRRNSAFSFHGNTTVANQRNAIKEGDILFSMEKAILSRTLHAHHVMVVKEVGTVTQKQLNDWKNKPNYAANFKVGDRYAIIVQGNTISNAPDKDGKNSPASKNYIGMPIQTATYNLTTDTYVRDYGDRSATKNFSTKEPGSGNQEIGRLTGYKTSKLKIGESIIRFIENVAYFLKKDDGAYKMERYEK